MFKSYKEVYIRTSNILHILKNIKQTDIENS